MIALLKYNYKLYIKTNKFIIPLLLFFIFQGISYGQIMKTDFLSNILLDENVVFLIMVSIGVIYSNSQDSITEQVIFLKVINKKVFWLSKLMFLGTIGILLSIISILIPILKNILEGGQFLNSRPSTIEILISLILLIIASLMGLLLGMILKPILIGKRIIILILIALISVIKGPFIDEFHFAKYILWILPPIYNISGSLLKVSEISVGIVMLPVFYSVIYISICIVAYIKLMKRVLF